MVNFRLSIKIYIDIHICLYTYIEVRMAVKYSAKTPPFGVHSKKILSTGLIYKCEQINFANSGKTVTNVNSHMRHLNSFSGRALRKSLQRYEKKSI